MLSSNQADFSIKLVVGNCPSKLTRGIDPSFDGKPGVRQRFFLRRSMGNATWQTGHFADPTAILDIWIYQDLSHLNLV